MADENTIYDENDATRLDNSNASAAEGKAQNEVPAAESQANGSKKGMWKKVAIGAGTGLVFGSAATVLTGFTAAGGETAGETGEAGEAGGDNHETAPGQNPLVDDSISMAACVDDDMSFSQAFAAARAEVGPGGAFEWHGQIYGTYTADEWDNMSAAEKDEYNDHFAWSSSSSSSTPPHHASSSATHDDDVQADAHETSQEGPATLTDVQANPSGGVASNDDVVVVSHTEPTESEVQVLGVVHDDETGMNIGGVMVDNQEVILIDVDDDLTFDVMASDLNSDGQLQENEMADISGQGLTVNDLGGYTDPSANMVVSNDEIDYTNEISGDA